MTQHNVRTKVEVCQVESDSDMEQAFRQAKNEEMSVDERLESL
jgi:hypothetical protein